MTWGFSPKEVFRRAERKSGSLRECLGGCGYVEALQEEAVMSGSISLPPIPLYLSYSANEVADAAAAAKGSVETQALVAHFQASAAKITSPNALLSDYKSLEVVLGAFGISNQINSTALLRQLLTQDPTSTTSVAYRIGNPKYLEFAKALSNWSTPPFATASSRASIVTAYEENHFEAQAGQQAPGLQDALYFTRQIGSVTSITQLQSDPTLLAVAVTTAGLPLTDFQLLPFTQQTKLLTSKIKLSDFKNPATVQRLAEQYLVTQQSTAGTATVAPGSLLSLFGGSDTSGNSILTVLQAAEGISSTGTTATSAAASILSLIA
jgi:hypothetical protein